MTKFQKKERKKRKRLNSASESEKKKSKGEDAPVPLQSQEVEAEPEDENSRDFRWGNVIKQVLLSQSDHEISLKKLRKKVLSEYHAVIGDSKGSKTQEELISKLNKKLKNQQFKVLKDSVKLVLSE